MNAFIEFSEDFQYEKPFPDKFVGYTRNEKSVCLTSIALDHSLAQSCNEKVLKLTAEKPFEKSRENSRKGSWVEIHFGQILNDSLTRFLSLSIPPGLE